MIIYLIYLTLPHLWLTKVVCIRLVRDEMTWTKLVSFGVENDASSPGPFTLTMVESR